MLLTSKLIAQPAIRWSELPPLPGGKGFAGMYAGVSHNVLLALGGANFPGAMPWEGGKKKWYPDIYVLEKGKGWVKAAEKLPVSAGYGVSVSYDGKVIIVGGSNEEGLLGRVSALEWKDGKITTSEYPPLPVAMANMGGLLMGDVIVVFGGNIAGSTAASRECLALDLQNPAAGWTALPAWPGPERILPVCARHQGHAYLFGGETTGINARGQPFRDILLDGYRLAIARKDHALTASWEKLAPMPRGMSAGGMLLPVLNNDRFLFWGGVDAVTAGYKVPSTHPGIIRSLLYYFPETDTWEYVGEQTAIPARVTLPVVFWDDQWIYISGEVKPGIRTPAVTGIRNGFE